MSKNKNLEDVEKESETSIMREFFSWIYTVGLALFIALFIIGNVGSMTIVSGISMEPSFYDQDRVILNRVSYRFKEIEVGDVVVLNTHKAKNGLFYNMFDEFDGMVKNIAYKLKFTEEIDKDNLIKRVVAKEGDVVEVIDGQLYVNNEPETRLTKQGETYEIYNYITYPMTIGKGEYFVLGDNREHSLDSRALGPIKEEQIKGKVSYRLLPSSRRGKIE